MKGAPANSLMTSEAFLALRGRPRSPKGALAPTGFSPARKAKKLVGALPLMTSQGVPRPARKAKKAQRRPSADGFQASR